MSKRSLGAVAIVLIALIALVAAADLDGLPRAVKVSAAEAVQKAQSTRSKWDSDRQAVNRLIASDASLFSAGDWQGRIDRLNTLASQEDAETRKLEALRQSNRREDRDAAVQSVARLDRIRGELETGARDLRADAEKRQYWKQHMPEALASIERSHKAIAAFDAATAAPRAVAAQRDWPAKRDDLAARLAALEQAKSRGEAAWQEAESARASNDYGRLFASLDRLSQIEKEQLDGAAQANTLASQLYLNWDKVLLDLDEETPPKQKVRKVVTVFPDATLANGAVTQEETWEQASAARFEDLKRNVGMVVERKPAGKYESEKETTLQAPGYAYIAPPGQANQYGSWNNGVWSWLPQYLILSQLLRGPSYPPVRMDDWHGYDRARRNGTVWGGGFNRTWGNYRDRGPSVGTAMRRALDGLRSRGPSVDSGSDSGRRRETWTWGGNSGGSYGGSRYQNRGSYGGSRYQSRAPSGGFGSRGYTRGFGGRSFGRGGRR